MKSVSVLCLLFVASICASNAQADKILVCYFGSWSIYRAGDGRYDIDFLPGDMCTHIIYSFIGAETDGSIKVMDPYADLTENYGKGGFAKFVGLRNTYPKVKFMIAMGGWNEGSVKYSELFRNSAMRTKFVKNAVEFLQQYGFDGFDLDWEYPAQRGGASEDKKNFVELIKEMKNAFAPHGYLLTAAVGASDNIMQLSYDVPNMGKYLDYINLMSYDFHTSGESLTGHNAPTYPSVSDQNNGLNVEYSVKSWIEHGVPSTKLVLGIPTYGQSFTLQSPTTCKTAGCPSAGQGEGGSYLHQNGFLGYNEWCIDSKWQTEWDAEAMVPYAVKGNQWIGYDNEKSVGIKAKLVHKFNLAGGMVWSIETDDFRGSCGKGKYPLVTAIAAALKGESFEPTTESEDSVSSTTAKPASITDESTSSTTPTSSNNSGLDSADCSQVGFMNHPTDCDKFYQCYLLGGDLKRALFNCPTGLHFDASSNICNYPSIAHCEF